MEKQAFRWHKWVVEEAKSPTRRSRANSRSQTHAAVAFACQVDADDTSGVARISDAVVEKFVEKIGIGAGTGRIDTIRALINQFAVKNVQISSRSIERLWLGARDLVQSTQHESVQSLALMFLCALLSSQAEPPTDLSRANIFEVVRAHENITHTPLLLDVIVLLTNNGKDIAYLEENICDCLLDLLQGCLNYACFGTLIKLLNVLFATHFDSLNQTSVHDLVTCVCQITSISFLPSDVSSCLLLFDTLIANKIVHPNHLNTILGALCRASLFPEALFNKRCVSLIERLINSEGRGMLTIVTLCNFLKDPRLETSINLLRGAVRMLTHAGWDGMNLTNLEIVPESLMPCFQAASYYKHPAVNLEIVVSLHLLIQKKGAKLAPPMWASIFSILQPCSQMCDICTHPELCEKFELLLKSLESLYESGALQGDPDQLFDLLESHPGDRDMTITLDYRIKSVHPSVTGWMNNMILLVQRYFQEDQRTDIRIMVLSVVEDIWKDARYFYEEQIITLILLRFFRDLNTEQDAAVTNSAVNLIAKVAQNCSLYYDQLLQIIINTLESDSDEQQFGEESDEQLLIERNTLLQLENLFKARFVGRKTQLTLAPLNVLAGFVHSRLQMRWMTPDPLPLAESTLNAIALFTSFRWDEFGRVTIRKFFGQEDSDFTDEKSPFFGGLR